MKLLCPLIFLVVTSTTSILSQSLLTLNDALSEALSKNYELQIVRNDLEIARKSDFYGNAGEQPTYNFTIGETAQLTGVNQQLASGSEISRIGVVSQALTSQLAISYPILNGFRVKATKGRIREQAAISEARVSAQIQNTAAQVINRYFDIVRQQKLIESLQKTLAVSEQRLELIKVRQSVGMANNSDLYLAELDLNARKQEVTNQDLALRQNKTDLNVLLSREKNMDFNVSDTILVDSNLNYENLLAFAKKSPDVFISEGQIRVVDWIEKETHAQRLPTVRLNGGVAASLSNTTAGFLLQNVSYGPFVGINLSVPLFNKNIFDRQEELVTMQRTTRQLQATSLQNTIEGNLFRTWQAYQTNLERIKSESENIKKAQQLLEIMLQRYQLNQSNTIDLREAQRSYEEAAFRLTSVQYIAKVAETELLRLAARLIVKE